MINKKLQDLEKRLGYLGTHLSNVLQEIRGLEVQEAKIGDSKDNYVTNKTHPGIQHPPHTTGILIRVEKAIEKLEGYAGELSKHYPLQKAEIKASDVTFPSIDSTSPPFVSPPPPIGPYSTSITDKPKY
jgi:hypothetical protein